MDLLPCPFCGSGCVSIQDGNDGNVMRGKFIKCMSCGVSGPCMDELSDSVAKWNTRVFHVAESCQVTYGNQSKPPTP